MAAEFARVGLDYQIWPALDGRLLTDEDRGFVDRDGRRRLGLYPIPDGSLANTLSQRAAMRDLVENGPDMMAVFEDDARFDPALPAVLSALEGQSDSFDVVILQRRNLRKRFIATTSLPTGHLLGRVRYSDYGSNGYVITRSAAERFLENYPRMTRELDLALSHFWENGLDVLYVDPPVVDCDVELESQIEETRHDNRSAHRGERRRRPDLLFRRIAALIGLDVRRRIAFRKLLLSDQIAVWRRRRRSPDRGIDGESDPVSAEKHPAGLQFVKRRPGRRWIRRS